MNNLIDNDILKNYKKIKPAIEQRLLDFKNLWQKAGCREIFTELCFCICTPQSKARKADEAITALKSKGLLYTGCASDLEDDIKNVRFYKNKSRYIVEARNFFKTGKKFKIKNRIDTKDILGTRDWFVENVKGIGYKEASHFLRNIGFGKYVAILDRHILKNLKKVSVLNEIPKTISRKKYFEIENNMKKFAKDIKIPIEHLDFLFWYNEAGEIFK